VDFIKFESIGDQYFLPGKPFVFQVSLTDDESAPITGNIRFNVNIVTNSVLSQWHLSSSDVELYEGKANFTIDIPKEIVSLAITVTSKGFHNKSKIFNVQEEGARSTVTPGPTLDVISIQNKPNIAVEALTGDVSRIEFTVFKKNSTNHETNVTLVYDNDKFEVVEPEASNCGFITAATNTKKVQLPRDSGQVVFYIRPRKTGNLNLTFIAGDEIVQKQIFLVENSSVLRKTHDKSHFFDVRSFRYDSHFLIINTTESFVNDSISYEGVITSQLMGRSINENIESLL
jgi:hypothetical protein